jgi:hypothetical protein
MDLVYAKKSNFCLPAKTSYLLYGDGLANGERPFTYFLWDDMGIWHALGVI